MHSALTFRGDAGPQHVLDIAISGRGELTIRVQRRSPRQAALGSIFELLLFGVALLAVAPILFAIVFRYLFAVSASAFTP